MLVSLLLSLLVLPLVPLILLCLVVAVVVATICVFFESHAVARTGRNEWKIHVRGSQPHACTRGRVAEKRATRMRAPRNHVVDLVAYKILDSLNMGASRNHMSPSTGRPPTLIHSFWRDLGISHRMLFGLLRTLFGLLTTTTSASRFGFVALTWPLTRTAL